MKKYFLGMTALLLAIAFSAFTSKQSKLIPYYWYNDATTSFVEYTGMEACQDGDINFCFVDDIPGQGLEQLYKTQSFSNPLKYDW